MEPAEIIIGAVVATAVAAAASLAINATTTVAGWVGSWWNNVPIKETRCRPR